MTMAEMLTRVWTMRRVSTFWLRRNLAAVAEIPRRTPPPRSSGSLEVRSSGGRRWRFRERGRGDGGGASASAR